jgi:hypothetical protein
MSKIFFQPENVRDGLRRVASGRRAVDGRVRPVDDDVRPAESRKESLSVGGFIIVEVN